MFNRRTAKHPHGSIIQLFKSKCAALVLLNLNGNKTFKFLRFGQFEISLIIQNTNNISMTACRVQELEWPIAKDALIVRLGQRSFAFAMPGLLYGVQLHPFSRESAFDDLERVFLKYSDYTNLLCEGMQANYPCAENDLNFWAIVRPQVEEICRGRFPHFDSLLGRSPSPAGGNSGGSTELSRTVRMMSRTTKFVADAMLTGAVKSAHIVVLDNRSDRAKRAQVDPEEAYASIEVVCNIVQANVEANTAVARLENWSEDAATDQQSEPGTNRPRLSGFKHWKLNEAGISIFLSNQTTDRSSGGASEPIDHDVAER